MDAWSASKVKEMDMRSHQSRFHENSENVPMRITVGGMVEAPGLDTSIPILHLSMEELALLSCYRELPDDETRLACLEALEDFLKC